MGDYAAVVSDDDVTPQDEDVPLHVPPDNLDLWLRDIYTFYISGGLYAWMLGEVVRLAIFLFTIAASMSLVTLDWMQLRRCTHTDCQLWDHTTTWHERHVFTNLMIIVYLTICATYTCWRLASACVTWSRLRHVQDFVHQRLYLHDMTRCTWDDVAQAITALRRDGGLFAPDPMTPTHIAMRILRPTNYMLALVQHDVLPMLRGNAFVTWMLHTVLLIPMWSRGKVRVRAAQFRRRCRRAALCYALCMPFLFLFLLVHALLEAAEIAARRRGPLRLRHWSPHATWTFRRYNEYTHDVEQRLRRATWATQKYIYVQPTPLLHVFAGGCMFFCGSTAGFIALTGLLDEDALAHVHVAGHNLVWWLAVCGAIYSIAYATYNHGRHSDHYDAAYAQHLLRTLEKETHLGTAHRLPLLIRREYRYFFSRWLTALLYGVGMPVLLMRWSFHGDAVETFISQHTTTSPVGDVCSFSVTTAHDPRASMDTGSHHSLQDRWPETMDMLLYGTYK